MNINLNLSFKKYIVGFLVIILLLSTMNIQAFAKVKNQQNGQDGEFELIKKDDKEVIVQGTWDEGVLIGTLNRETNEVTIEEILNETSANETLNLVSKGKGKKNKYKAKIHTLDPYEGKVDAVLINMDTNEEIELYSEGEKVEAQLVQIIPLITWGGGALLSWLAAHAASITIAGITAYALTDVYNKYRENKKYNYWKAWVRKKDGKYDVFVSEEALTDSAAFTWLSSSNGKDVNVFAKTKAKAEEAARKTKGASHAHYHDGHSNEDGYYQHQHPAKYDSAGKRILFKNHIWF